MPIFFQVDIDTLWLHEEGLGQTAYFPNDSNTDFGFGGESVISTLIVEGRSEVPHPPEPSTSSTATMSATRRPPIAPLGGRKGGGNNVSLKILQATLKRSSGGKPEFELIGQYYVDVTESTANISYINRQIKKHWGKEYILVSSEGLRFEDSDSTQGNSHIV